MGIDDSIRISGIVVGLLLSTIASSDAINTADAVDRRSYSLGFSMALALTDRKTKVDPVSLSKGIEDALQDLPPLLDAEQIERITAASHQLLSEGMNLAKASNVIRQEQFYQDRRRSGIAFMQANQDRGEVVTLPSGVQYKVLAEGHGAVPGSTDRVQIEYRATTLNGQSLGGGRDKPILVTRPVKSLIKGLSEAVQLMPTGAHWEVYIPPDLAYGRRGRLAYQTVIFDIKLLEINPAGAH